VAELPGNVCRKLKVRDQALFGFDFDKKQSLIKLESK
jgi:hypothetical protein